MRLRSLQIKGFKSFANDTILNFEENVIGIVGPNGSGKSNIVDAVRWVLGEQKSKELRLDKMSDIIFNGTKTRKEAGAAQVSLTFDNTRNILPTEYQTVTISRFLYRSGESEYRLNNVPCRLKDIRSLFIDTGIGSNSYAIIALGMVDDILADKDQARRRMFEQAAGISKYKSRKRETLNKLKSTTEDLDRIEDLLYEIENNLKTLEKQARRTRKYFEIKEQYKDLSVTYALRSISTLKEQYRKKRTEISDEESKYNALNTELVNAEAELQSIKSKHLDQEQNLSDSQKVLNELVNTIRSEENQKNLASQRLDFKEQEIGKLKGNIQRAEQQLEEMANSIKGLELRLEAEMAKLEKLKTQTESALEAYQGNKESYARVRSELDRHARQKQSLQEQLFDREKKLAVTQNNLDNTILELQHIDGRVVETGKKLESLQKDYELINKDVAIRQKAVQDKEAFLARQEAEIQQLGKEKQQIQDELALLYRKQDAARNEYDLLKSMVDSFEGFPESIKYLSTQWKKEVPILSDLLDVEDKYRGAIEQFLDPYLNCFIVDKVEDARQAIGLLANTQKGRASFFLLDAFSDYSPLEVDISIPGGIRAREVVGIDQKYSKVLDVLLEHVYIFNGSMEDLGSLPLPKEVTLLAESGMYVRKARQLQGGSVGLFEGKRIGRKKSLEKLEKKIKKLNQDIEAADKKLQSTENQLKLAREHNIHQSLGEARNGLKLAEEKLFQAKYRLDNTSEESVALHQKNDQLKDQRSTLEQHLQSLSEGLENVKKELQALSSGKLFSDEEIDQLSHDLSRSQETYNSLNIESIKQQNLVDTFSRELEMKNTRLTEIREGKQNDLSMVDANLKEKDLLKKEIEELEQSLQAKYARRETIRKDLNQVEQNYYAARNTISEKEEKVRVMNRTLNQAQVHINQLKEEYNSIKFSISGVGERLNIEFNINLNDIINDEADESMPFDELKERVEKLKGRIANFGEINPMAVTAYDEMKERYDTIQGQREDILEAKKSLLKTIDEIETTATERFMEAFANVRENFIKVFRSLFTEDDTCDLVLIDDSNPLESDIEIIAKPKGKKPKSLSQLSGGEKTLTATALLFALYLLKPAPFCIFDEVDAPLDDANIQKFNKIIKKFSTESQFIIVTHNKSTMAAVDVLYGVYMQEQGVSAVTPVDFRSYEYKPVVEVVNN